MHPGFIRVSWNIRNLWHHRFIQLYPIQWKRFFSFPIKAQGCITSLSTFSSSTTSSTTGQATFARYMQAAPPFSELSELTPTCVWYFTATHSSSSATSRYYRHICEVQNHNACPTSSRLENEFSTPSSFIGCCDQMRRETVTADGWMRAVISLPGCPVNRSGWFCCPLQLLRSVLHQDVTCHIIPFREDTENSGHRFYGTPWCSRLYEHYNEDVRTGHAIIVDFYSHGATLSKSGTQSTTIVRVRFSNLVPFTEQWFTFALALHSSSIPSSFTDEGRRQLKLKLYHRFLFRTFSNLIRSLTMVSWKITKDIFHGCPWSFPTSLRSGCTIFKASWRRDGLYILRVTVPSSFYDDTPLYSDRRHVIWWRTNAKLWATIRPQ